MHKMNINEIRKHFKKDIKEAKHGIARDKEVLASKIEGSKSRKKKKY